MSSKPVYQYIWRDHSLPARRSLVLTLKDHEAIAFLAMVTTLVAYTQSRSWHLLRRLFIRLTKSNIELPVPEGPALSQSKTIAILFNSLCQRRKRRSTTDSIRTISPLNGIFALANIMCFLALGIILPWTLSGGLETPVVLSGPQEDCNGFQYMFETSANDARLADLLFKQSWHKLPEVNNQTDPTGQTDGVFKDRPILYISPDECPFSGDTCEGITPPIRLEHRNLTLRNFGVNSKSRVLMSHRLTCSPLNLNNFLNVSRKDTFLGFLNWNHPNVAEHGLDFGTFLFSRNGPNRFSKLHSGRMAAEGNQPYRLDLFPRHKSNQKSLTNYTDLLQKFHPDLRRSGGNVFVVSYRAGRSFYSHPMNDAFFSAHELDEKSLLYYPDYEVTGMGCLEQYQLCIPGESGHCTEWFGDQNAETTLNGLVDILMPMGDRDSAYDIAQAHIYLMHIANVQTYLHARPGVQALISSEHRTGDQIPYTDANEQWIVEMKAWFETSFLRARYGVFNLLKHDYRPEGFPHVPQQHKKLIGSICYRVVFFDSNYTNIDFIQLLISLTFLTLLCLLSVGKEIKAGAMEFGHWCKAKTQKALHFCCHAAKQHTRWPSSASYAPKWFRSIQHRRGSEETEDSDGMNLDNFAS